MRKKTVLWAFLLLFVFAGYVNAGEQKIGWYMDVEKLGTADALAVSVMQGIANRHEAKFFIYTGDRHWVTTFKRKWVRHSDEILEKYRNVDDAWKDYLETKHGYKFEELPSINELVAKLGNKIKGTVFYDDSEAHHYVLATALASAYDLIPVTEKVQNRYPALGAFIPKFNVSKDFDNLLDAHKKIWNEHGDKYTKEAVYSIGAESHVYGLDMAVAQKMFVYRLNCDKNKKPDEAAFVKEIISSLDPLSPAWGWGEPSESILRNLISEAGGFVMCSGIPNTSFLHKLKPLRKDPFKREIPLEDYKNKKLKNKYYISFMVNEGDTIKASGALMCYGMWLEPQRGSVPISWGVCPWLYDEFPAMMEYYYINATANDSFFPATSGYGYFTQILTPYLDEFVKREISVNTQSDMQVGASWGCDKLNEKEPGLRDRWLDSRKMMGYVNETAGDIGPSLQFTPENRPVLNCDWKMFYWWHRFGNDLSEDEIYQKTVEYIEKITTEHEPPFFIPIYGGMPNWFDRLKTMLGEDKYEFVLLEEMSFLAKQAGQIHIEKDYFKLEKGSRNINIGVSVRNISNKSYSGTVSISLPQGWTSNLLLWKYPELKSQTGNASKEIKLAIPTDCTSGKYKVMFKDSATGMSDVAIVEVK
jgi:hypothetical protein